MINFLLIYIFLHHEMLLEHNYRLSAVAGICCRCCLCPDSAHVHNILLTNLRFKLYYNKITWVLLSELLYSLYSVLLSVTAYTNTLGVFPPFLKKVADIIAIKLSIIFRRLIRQVSFPGCWSTNVTAIPKGAPSLSTVPY